MSKASRGIRRQQSRKIKAPSPARDRALETDHHVVSPREGLDNLPT